MVCGTNGLKFFSIVNFMPYSEPGQMECRCGIMSKRAQASMSAGSDRFNRMAGWDLQVV
jgi:hypothetical protein